MEKLTSLQYCLLIIQYSFLKALLVALGTEEKKLCFVDFRIDYTTMRLYSQFHRIDSRTL